MKVDEKRVCRIWGKIEKQKIVFRGKITNLFEQDYLFKE